MYALPEYNRSDVQPGVRCEECKITYSDASALDRVQLADAELIFCPKCQMAIAVLVDRVERRKSA